MGMLVEDAINATPRTVVYNSQRHAIELAKAYARETQSNCIRRLWNVVRCSLGSVERRSRHRWRFGGAFAAVEAETTGVHLDACPHGALRRFLANHRGSPALNGQATLDRHD